MKQRGRKSSAALAVVTPIGTRARLKAPKTLTPEQRRIWRRVVMAKPPDWFGGEHVPILESYCRHQVNAAMLAGLVAEVRPADLETDEGLARHERLLRMHATEAKAVSDLATRMRLTQQAVLDKRVAGRKADAFTPEAKKPWQAA